MAPSATELLIKSRRPNSLMRRRRARAIRMMVTREDFVRRPRRIAELVRGQLMTDRKLAEALLLEAIDAMLNGDVRTGQTILRHTLKAINNKV